MRKNVNIVLVAIAATTVFSASGVESSMSGTDILAGRSLSDFICRNAAPETVTETFSLTNGVLTANAAHALVLESPERYDCESFVLSAEVRYESDGFADSGLQFCIEDVAGKNAVRRRMEYQLKTVDFTFFFDGKLVNAFVIEGATSGRIGFQTKPYPEGRGAVSFRNVRMLQL